MSSPNRSSQESFSSSTKGQGTEQAFLLSSTGLVVVPEEMAPPTLSLPFTSSDDDRRNGVSSTGLVVAPEEIAPPTLSLPFTSSDDGRNGLSSTGLVVAPEEMVPPISLPSTSNDDGRNVPVMRRCFCLTCNCTTNIDPSAAWMVSCPICCGPFQPEQEAQAAAAFPSQSSGNATVRAAGFENWHICNNLFYVAWEHDFFSHPFCRTPEVVRVPIPSAGMLISLLFLQGFLHDCFKSGASITISPDEEADTTSLMSNTEALLSNLEVRDGLLYSSEMICSVCLDSLSNGKKVRETPCSHSFHEYCLIPWLIKDKTCPICRSKIITEASETEIVLFSDTVEDLRHLGAFDFCLRPNPIIRKFKIELLWPHGGTSSHVEASSSGGGHDANHTS